ncbi:MAG: hypothetical protein LBE32_05080 [Burkholderiales bacterium]|jgi:hypothetical protein|nr:hypothetical protein [Burkholderiales bacterium]
MDADGFANPYPTELIQTPWEKLRSIPGFEQHLKPGMTAQQLHETVMSMTDSQAVQKLQDMRRKLFGSFRKKGA